MSREYPILGSPIQVNGVILKNRMITTSMSPGHGYVEDSVPTDRLINYLEERAAGGTAMITQTMLPWKRPSEEGLHPLPGAYDESCLPHLERMSGIVHKHGGLICGQPYFVHDWKPSDAERESPWGPSEIAVLPAMGGFKTMSLEQIEEFKAMYANCARILKMAGFDCVEVMAGVGGILSRFMSQATNNRTDQYGGSVENRARLTVETLQAVREVVGPDFPIMVRWSPVDFIKTDNGPGLSMEEALQIVPMLEEAGCDLHDLAVGWHETSVPLTTKRIEDGHWTYISQQIKTVAKKPVAQGYRNTDPKVMEQNLRDGKLDVIAGLRYSIADPDLPKKVMEDRTDDMRLCIVCCRCLDDVVSGGKPLTHCGVNPHLGPELDHELYPAAEAKKKVMIVGGGPAGMSAALTASRRGHSVDLYEMGPRLGGCTKMSSIFSPYHERYLNYLVSHVNADANITVHLKTTVTPDTVRAKQPDATILAVGGEPNELDVPGANGKNVCSSHDFLEMLSGHAPKKQGAFNSFMWNAGSIFLRYYYTPSFARKVTEVSPWPLSKDLTMIGGGLPGCEMGEMAMKTKRHANIVEPGKKIAYDVSPSERFGVKTDFKKSPLIETYTLTRVTEITSDGVKAIQKVGDEEKEIFLPTKTVVVTLGLHPDEGLADAFAGSCPEIYLVGNCKKDGRIADATKDGYVAACAI